MESELGRIGGDGTGLGPFARLTDAAEALGAIAKITSSVIGVFTIAASVWFLLQFAIGGFGWITSGGDKNKLQQARDRITNGFIGLIIVVAGATILSLAGQFFGFDITLSDPENVINTLTPGL